MARQYAPIPLNDPLVVSKMPKGEELRGYVTPLWITYLSDQGVQIADRPERVATVDLSGQTASIGATNVPVTSLTHGLYRVSYYVRVTTALGGTTVTVTIDWKDGGVTCSHSSAAINGAATSNYGSGTLFMDVDNLGPIRYATTYAGGAGMIYKLVLSAEKVAV